MSQFLISRSTRNRRLSRIQVLLVLAVLIMPCVLPLTMPQAMALLAPACVLAPAHLSRPSFVICPSARPSSSHFSPTASRACRGSEFIDVTKRAQRSVDIDKTSRLCVQALTLCSQPRSLPSKQRASCQTGPCQRLQIYELRFEQTAFSDPHSWREFPHF